LILFVTSLVDTIYIHQLEGLAHVFSIVIPIYEKKYLCVYFA